MNVLRIEKANGQGMFMGSAVSAYEIISEACDRHFTYRDDCIGEYFPRPEEEDLDLYKNDKTWFCAFKSIEQLNKLLREDELEKLIDHGFNIYILDVTEYQQSEHQVLFTRESITSKQEINSLFKTQKNEKIIN